MTTRRQDALVLLVPLSQRAIVIRCLLQLLRDGGWEEAGDPS